jgi:hypothetical protein
MPANTIDEVVDRLEGIIHQSIASGDRRGYFAALYNRVTLRVREGVRRGEFEDNPRMERLDVVFANRYLDAYDAYARGATPTRPWLRAFDAARRDGLFVIQHLLLGMISHIMLDLGIAAAEVAPGRALAAMRRDYLHINDLLAEEIDLVEAQLEEVTGRWSPDLGALLGLLDNAAGSLEETAASLVIDAARGRAWDFAVQLADTPALAHGAIVTLHEATTTMLCDAVLMASPVAELLGEGRDVAENIRILARGESGV